VNKTALSIKNKQKIPLYRQLSQRLEASITNGTFLPGAAMPSITEIASEADVSLVTAEMAVKDLIAQGYCYRRPKKGTFVAERRINTNPHRMIMVYDQSGGHESNEVLHPTTRGIHQAASEYKIDCLNISGRLEDSLNGLAHNNQIDVVGVIIIGFLPLTTLNAIAEQHPKINFVVTNYQQPEFAESAPNIYGIFNDEFAGSYLLVDYLLDQGCRNIGVIIVDDVSANYTLRLNGYKQRLQDGGIAIRTELIERVEWQAERTQVGYNGARALMAKPPIDAIMTFNDIYSQGVCQYLEEHQLSGKIKVTGYDNHLPEISAREKFTTVAINAAEMGRLAVKKAMENSLMAKTILLTPHLLPR